MGDEQNRLAGGIPDLLQLLLQELPVLRVKRAERLVHQHDLGIEREETRQGNALLHSAGQFIRVVITKLAQAHHVDETVGDGLTLGI